MTARITRTGTLRVDAMSADIWDDRLVAAVVAIRPEDGDIRSLDDQRVRITIEPADAPAHGDALDYLAEAKRMIASGDLDVYVTATGEEFGESADAARLLSMLNSAHLAILAERARR